MNKENLIKEIRDGVRGITLNSQLIDLFNILNGQDDRLSNLENYLTNFIDKHSEEYTREVALKCVLALQDDNEIDKNELYQIFKYAPKLEGLDDIKKILESSGFSYALPMLFKAKDSIQTEAKEGIEDFLIKNPDGTTNLEETYKKVKAFYEFVIGEEDGIPRFNRITLDGQGKIGTYRNANKGKKVIYNTKPMQEAIDFINSINQQRSDNNQEPITVRMNALCFYNDFPPDLIGKDSETVKQALIDYGINMGKQFRGTPFTIVDMFNEFINEDTTYYSIEESKENPVYVDENGVQQYSTFTQRTNGWHSILSIEDICEVALKIKEEMPEVDFGYNDWNYENPEKRKAIFGVIKQILDFQNDKIKNPKGLKILNHIGMQFHTSIDSPVSEIRKIFDDAKLAGLDPEEIPFDITELDITRDISGFDYEHATQEELDAAEKYSIGRQNLIMQELLRLYEDGLIRGITAWSQSDEMSFLGKDTHASIFEFDGEQYKAKDMSLYLEKGIEIPQLVLKNILRAKENIQQIQDFNYHGHTRRCGHPPENSHARDEEYVQHAINGGMTKIAFTDHIPFPEGTKYEENSRMNYKEADEYLTSIASLAKKYEGRIDIEAGFEFEYAEGKYLENILQLKALIKDKTGQDGKMILGQHWVEVEKEDGKGTERIPIDTHIKNDANKNRYLIKYKEAIIKAMKTKVKGKNLVDIVAHPDRFLLASSEFGQIEESIALAICDAAIETGIPLEINMGELSKMIDTDKPISPVELQKIDYPSKQFWEIVARQSELSVQKGGKPINVVYGKDAHFASQLSNPKDFEIVKQLLGEDLIHRLHFVEKDLTTSKKEVKIDEQTMLMDSIARKIANSTGVATKKEDAQSDFTKLEQIPEKERQD